MRRWGERVHGSAPPLPWIPAGCGLVAEDCAAVGVVSEKANIEAKSPAAASLPNARVLISASEDVLGQP